MPEEFGAAEFGTAEWLHERRDSTPAEDPACPTEFGWVPLPGNVIPLPRRAPDDVGL
jgi:hypothetical protein